MEPRSSFQTTCFSKTTGAWLKVVKAWLPGAHQKSRVLTREPELGPWPVARGLSVDGSEGEVDAWTAVVVLLGHPVLVDTHTHTQVRGTQQVRLAANHNTSHPSGQRSDDLISFSSTHFNTCMC